ncbi:aspartyl-phosphate phosphatase Spo0E family protein [Peribacillus kribbensis]|uniref:aspartyl-phosphate phosphatase Spo0E family protein n=1 Tax=Peribacillus kribbensis TaxID=356658 RepID=UPI000408B27D|nr:aspartyl-phosphate phosphatase Spo0E family protein [Peribacillus kribbensis]
MDSTEIKNMQKLIQLKRQDMMNSARVHGLTHLQTIQYSQELDELINVYLSVKNTQKKEVKYSMENMIVIFQQSFSDMELI